jgi:hypothetical protein
MRFIVKSGLTAKDFYFDVGNEHNDPILLSGHLSIDELKDIFAVLRKEFPDIKLTASITGYMEPEKASLYAKESGMDILSYHEHRGKGLWEWDKMDVLVKRLKSHFDGPVYIDEPACSDYKYTSAESSNKLEEVTTDRLLEAYRSSMKGGAEQWVLHNHGCWPPNFPGLGHGGRIPEDLKQPERGFFDEPNKDRL